MGRSHHASLRGPRSTVGDAAFARPFADLRAGWLGAAYVRLKGIHYMATTFKPPPVRYNPTRAEKPPFKETWLTDAKIEAIRTDAMADDIEYDIARLCLRSADDVMRFFEDGGDELCEPENSLALWLRTNVTNAAHLKMLNQTLLSAFADLPALLRSLDSHPDQDEAMDDLLARIEVDKFQAGKVKGTLAPLWDLARRAPAETYNAAEPEFDSARFAAWLGARVAPIGWGAPLPWEASHKLFVPRKPYAVMRLFLLGGISETARSFERYVRDAPSWLCALTVHRPTVPPSHRRCDRCCRCDRPLSRTIARRQ
jgi:hypothetical protein